MKNTGKPMSMADRIAMFNKKEDTPSIQNKTNSKTVVHRKAENNDKDHQHQPENKEKDQNKEVSNVKNEEKKIVFNVQDDHNVKNSIKDNDFIVNKDRSRSSKVVEKGNLFKNNPFLNGGLNKDKEVEKKTIKNTVSIKEEQVDNDDEKSKNLENQDEEKPQKVHENSEISKKSDVSQTTQGSGKKPIVNNAFKMGMAQMLMKQNPFFLKKQQEAQSEKEKDDLESGDDDYKSNYKISSHKNSEDAPLFGIDNRVHSHTITNHIRISDDNFTIFKPVLTKKKKITKPKTFDIEKKDELSSEKTENNIDK